MATMPAGTKVALEHKGQLRVCALVSGAPYISEGNSDTGSGTGSGLVHGFDVDVTSLVAKRLRATPVFERLEGRDFIKGSVLPAHRCDIVDGLTDWSGFKKVYRLSVPYERRAFSLLTKKGGPASPAALAGKRVVVTGDPGGDPATDPYAYLKRYNAAHGGRIQLVQQSTADVAVMMVRTGQAAAMLTDEGRAHYYAKKQPELAAGATFGTPTNLVYGVRKGNKTLAEQVDAALADAGGNGQYASAYWTSFGVRPAWTPGH